MNGVIHWENWLSSSNTPNDWTVFLSFLVRQCEQGRLARVEQLAERYTVEAQATLLEGVGVLAGPWPHTFLLNLLPPTEVPQLDVEIGRRRPVQWQLRLTDVAVRCLRCAIDALARHDGRPPVMRIAANWRRWAVDGTFEPSAAEERNQSEMAPLVAGSPAWRSSTPRFSQNCGPPASVTARITPLSSRPTARRWLPPAW